MPAMTHAPTVPSAEPPSCLLAPASPELEEDEEHAAARTKLTAATTPRSRVILCMCVFGGSVHATERNIHLYQRPHVRQDRRPGRGLPRDLVCPGVSAFLARR